MDVYVVSDCWWREGATVVGAGATLDDAKEIAGRWGERDQDARVDSWSEWKPDVPSTRSGEARKWTRDALTADGSPHPSLYQEIVAVPLADFPHVPRAWDSADADPLGDLLAFKERLETDSLLRPFTTPRG